VKTLEEILADAEGVKDDLEVEIPGVGKFKLADFRSDRVKTKAALKKASEEQQAAAKLRDDLARLGDEGAKLMEQLDAQRAALPKQKTEGEIDWETDAIYGPVYTKQIKPLNSKLDELGKAIAKLGTDFAQSALFVMQDYYNRMWNSVPEETRPKDKSWKDYVRVAKERNILNEFNLPDPVAALMSEIAPVQRKGLEDEVARLKAENDELKKNANAPRMPKPAGAGGAAAGGAGGKQEKPFGSVDEMVDAAFADPLIQNIIANGPGE